MLSSLWPPVTLGGAEAYAHALAEQLRDREWHIGVMTLGVEGSDVVAAVRPWPYRLDQYEAHSRATRAVFHALDVHRPGVMGSLRRAVEAFAPDVVHSHSVAGLSTVALTGPSRLGVAHVHTLHDYWLLCRRSSLVSSKGTSCQPRCRSCRLVSDLRARAIRAHPPDVVIAVSHAIEREHRELDWVADRVRVIRNPVTPVGQARRAVTTPCFGFLGRLTPEKGVTTLVDAFLGADLAPGAELLVAGDGPLRDALDRRRVDSVRVLGWLEGAAKEAFWRRIDCLVVPSEWPDPAPLVIDEARGRLVPVVGADIGGVPELIASPDAPLLFPPGDRGALAQALGRFAADPARFADDGRGTIDWPTHVDAVISAYDDATSR